ncbi:porin family protein [Leadbetterella byssophila]|uniref:porin family protein n=1 Tax=Leadbetterella byssophila TaxID=316068 RepID=UPI0039A08B3B
MKKPLIILLFSLISATTFAQSRFGVKVGGNMANIKFGETLPGVELKSIFTPQAGLVYYSDLSKPLFVQTGLFFNQKGTSMNIDDPIVSAFFGDSKIKVTYSFVELPINVGYQIPVGDNFAIAPFVGGFVGYAVMGKAKIGSITYDLFDDEEAEDLISAKDRLDYGVNAGLGFHIGKRLIISGQYSHGLANLSDEDPKVNTQTITAGLTFLF